jgi:hypothetical protein
MYKSGSVALPLFVIKLPATTGVGMMNGSAARKPNAGRRCSAAQTVRISITATATLRITSGIFITTTDGRKIQKNGAVIQASTASW